MRLDHKLVSTIQYRSEVERFPLLIERAINPIEAANAFVGAIIFPELETVREGTIECLALVLQNNADFMV